MYYKTPPLSTLLQAFVNAAAMPKRLLQVFRRSAPRRVAGIAALRRTDVCSFCYVPFGEDDRSSRLISIPMVTTATHPTTLCHRKAIEE